jgi:hypothetical protein
LQATRWNLCGLWPRGSRMIARLVRWLVRPADTIRVLHALRRGRSCALRFLRRTEGRTLRHPRMEVETVSRRRLLRIRLSRVAGLVALRVVEEADLAVEEVAVVILPEAGAVVVVEFTSKAA